MTTLAAPEAAPTGKLLKVDEVSQRLDVPKSTIYEWGRTGRIPGVVRLGRTMRFRGDALEAWLQAGGSAVVGGEQ